jgi:hypothetical protein
MGTQITLTIPDDLYQHARRVAKSRQQVDHDRDLAELVGRIRRRYAPAFVLIRKVETEPERTYYFRSPRFVR